MFRREISLLALVEALVVTSNIFRVDTERHNLDFTLESKVDSGGTDVGKRLEVVLFDIVSSTDDGVEDGPQFLFSVEETDLLTSDQFILNGILVVFVVGGDSVNRTAHAVFSMSLVGKNLHQVTGLDI